MPRGREKADGSGVRRLLLGVSIGISALLTLALIGSTVYRVVVTDRPPPEPVQPAPIGAEPIRVEVLNGCGVQGAANAAASLLRSGQGFDVVAIGNAPDASIGRSIVLDRVGDAARAGRVARALDIDEVLFQRSDDERMDVTVIVGYDDGRWDVAFGDR